MVSFIDKVKGKLTGRRSNAEGPDRSAAGDQKEATGEKPPKATREPSSATSPSKPKTEPNKAKSGSGDGAEKTPPRRRRRPRKQSGQADMEQVGTTNDGHTADQEGKPDASPESKSGDRKGSASREGANRAKRGDRGGRGRGRRRERTGGEGRDQNQQPEAREPAPVSDWDPAKYHVEPEAGKVRFHDLDLNPQLMHAVYDLGFKYCTPIQAGILPDMIKGRDAIGKAQTGTGKTAAFLLCMFNHFINKPRENAPPGTPRALVLAPTRELVIQIEKEARDIGKYTNFHSLAVYGGIDYKKQLNTLAGGPIDLLVATPGRLLDFRRSQDVQLGKVETLVIDEADRMLDMGFIPDVRNIVHSTPHKDKRQTLFFSATFNNDVIRLANQWTRSPVQVEIEPEQVAAENVKQVVYLATKKEKLPIVYNILGEEGTDRVLIFSNWREEARRLQEALKDYGFNCALLSGAVDQSKRQKTLEAFKAGKIKIIVATDVAGRGIHVEGLSHVINYDLPHDPEDYVHRIGRTGRAGASGTSISFATEDDAFMLPDIEEFLGDSLKCEYPGEEMLHIPARPARSHPERDHHSQSDRPPRSGNRNRGGGGRRGGNRPRGSRRA